MERLPAQAWHTPFLLLNEELPQTLLLFSLSQFVTTEPPRNKVGSSLPACPFCGPTFCVWISTDQELIVFQRMVQWSKILSLYLFSRLPRATRQNQILGIMSLLFVFRNSLLQSTLVTFPPSLPLALCGLFITMFWDPLSMFSWIMFHLFLNFICI